MTLTTGYHDVPLGKLANVVTVLEMRVEPQRDRTRGEPWNLRRVIHPNLEWYRHLYRRVGGEWLWATRLPLSDDELRREIDDPDIELYAMSASDDDIGIVELDFRADRECQLRYFGIAPEFIGRGAGRWLIQSAIRGAWARPIARFWLNTCTLDHPRALAFYQRAGFSPVGRRVEVLDDPRLLGLLPHDVAPQVPMIRAREDTQRGVGGAR